MRLLDGKKVAHEIQADIKKALEQKKARAPLLAAVLTTKHPASATYVRRKVAACRDVGISSRVLELAPKSTEELIDTVEMLNQDEAVDGILLQLPFPDTLHPMPILQKVAPEKDVDGFHPVNAGKLLLGDQSGFVPCTPLGIQALLNYYDITTEKKHVVILGRSNIVGKPLAALLVQNRSGCNATVTICHSKTQDLKTITKSADILIAAIGRAEFVKKDMVREGAVVIDVGINRKEDATKKSGFALVGDVAFDEVAPLCEAITPVPGGVGPMTIAMLLKNTYRSYLMRT